MKSTAKALVFVTLLGLLGTAFAGSRVQGTSVQPSSGVTVNGLRVQGG